MLSEPEPIKASTDDWGSEFVAGERQWITGKTELGWHHQGFEFAYQQRVLADVRFNPEAAAFYGRVYRGEQLAPGEEVPIEISVNGFTARGFRAGLFHHARTWALGGSVALLQARHLMMGSVQGKFVATGPSDYDFNARVDYYYDQDPIFDRPDVEKATGVGWTFQLQGEWQPAQWLTLRAQAQDLFARIRWADAPYTRARAHTNRKRYDEEGYAIFNPLLEGEEGYEDTYQDLDPRYQVDADIRLGRFTAHVQGRQQFDYGFAGLGAGVRFGDDLHMKAMTWPEIDAYGLQLDYRRVSLGLSLDDPNSDKAQYVGVHLSLNI